MGLSNLERDVASYNAAGGLRRSAKQINALNCE